MITIFDNKQKPLWKFSITDCFRRFYKPKIDTKPMATYNDKTVVVEDRQAKLVMEK